MRYPAPSLTMDHSVLVAPLLIEMPEYLQYYNPQEQTDEPVLLNPNAGISALYNAYLTLTGALEQEEPVLLNDYNNSSPYVVNGNMFGNGGNLFYPGGDMQFAKTTKYGHTIFQDKNGFAFAYGVKPGTENIKFYDNDGDGVFTDRVAIKDWMYDKGAKAVRERQLRQQYDAQHGKGTYNAKKTLEWTAQLEAKAMQPDTVDKLLLLGLYAAMGIGMGADMASHLPIYSSIKAALVGSEALLNRDLVKGTEALMWGLPLVGGVYSQSVKPALETGIQALKTVYDNGTFWDKYTTIGGRIGNWGDNWLDRVWGTAARRFGLPDRAKVPEFMRKLKNEDISYLMRDGDVNLTGNKLYRGNPHTNFTWDRPVVSHASGNWDSGDLYIVSGEDVLKQTPSQNLISIEPSDSFVNGNEMRFNPQRVTLVSGNIKRLEQAKLLGMQTLSSPRLRRMYKEAMDNHAPLKAKGLNLDKGAEHDLGLPYALEIQRLQSTRGVPTYADALTLEQRTGLNAGVAPYQEKVNFDSWRNALLTKSMDDLQPYIYPNGQIPDPANITTGTDGFFIDSTPYNNLWYQYASPVEDLWKKLHGIF